MDRFPTTHAGVVHVVGVVNGPSSTELLSDYEREQSIVAERVREGALADLPSIAAWRRAFSSFGVQPTQYRSAAEALLRRLTKQGAIPSINALVDLGNLVSIRHAVPVAVADLAGIAEGITVSFATGDEQFTNLGSDQPQNPEPGEVVFVDAKGTVHARRWCWRQSAQSAATDTTTDALIVVEGHHDAAAPDIEQAVADVNSLLARFQPQADVEAFLLSSGTPATD